MNLKRVFGTILTVLGIAGLIYGGIVFLQSQKQWLPALISFGIGGIFFASGIGLIKGTKDEA